jgi:membrane-bound lytic murein transglycosylase D
MRNKQLFQDRTARQWAIIFWAVMLITSPLLAQTPDVPQVPATLRFADITLHLTEKAQREIQADVDALYRSPKFFYMKLERVDLYLPLIEPIFAQHGIPDDFKYLVIQESALISDAVSSSNAVGFWQFKEASATEVGMRVDRQVDERINIISSTHGAARYLQRSNNTFDNWLYSLQSYQMGLGGASRALDKRYYGAREMKIDSDTYWYVKKFLSHLVAFRDAVGKEPRNQMLFQYKDGANKTLASIAEEFNTPLEQLQEYNKWLKTNRVPDDRSYVVMIPVQIDEAPNLLAESQARPKKDAKGGSLEDRLFGEKQKQPDVPPAEMDRLVLTKINNLKAVVARSGDTSRDLAKAGGISIADFLKYNDILPGDGLKAGQVYYFQRKKKKATVYRHVATEEETLWDISQKYGLRLDKLLQKNRMKQQDQLSAGQIVWLRYIRPANEPVAFETVPQRDAQSTTLPRQEKVATPAERQTLLASAGQLPETTTPVAQPQAPEAGVAPQVARETAQPTLAADSPVVQKSQPILPKQLPQAAAEAKKDSLTTRQPELHLYPGAAGMQRNISSEKDEKAAEAPLQQPVARPADAPDGFGTQVQVTFIDEEGRPLQQEPASQQLPSPAPTPGEQASTSAQQPSMQPESPQLALEAAPATPAKDSVHVVQAGETLYSLSRRYGLSVQELRSFNNMSAEGVLSIGQSLRLVPVANSVAVQPAGPSAALATVSQPEGGVISEDSRHIYHTVAEGETMYRVARRYNVTIKDIMEWNKKADFSIQPGETLVVGKK